MKMAERLIFNDPRMTPHGMGALFRLLHALHMIHRFHAHLLPPLLVTSVLLAEPAPLKAQFSYTTNAGTISITGYSGTGGFVMIPGTINGLPVTSIGGDAFTQCPSLTIVTIPGSITSIGVGAFYGCSGLTTVTISNGVPSIGDFAFYGCTSLASVTIPVSVTSIGYATFENCSSLVSVTILGNVTSIADYSFTKCTSLTGVYFTGNAPSADSTVFNSDGNATVFYLPRTTGWGDFSTNSGLHAVLWDPIIEADGADFGVQNNQFGFNITGTNNFTFVVEVCTNLANPVWVPLTTNTVVNGLFHFSELVQTNSAGRFYGLGFP
jgi:hypothetical protein